MPGSTALPTLSRKRQQFPVPAGLSAHMSPCHRWRQHQTFRSGRRSRRTDQRCTNSQGCARECSINSRGMRVRVQHKFSRHARESAGPKTASPSAPHPSYSGASAASGSAAFDGASSQRHFKPHGVASRTLELSDLAPPAIQVSARRKAPAQCDSGESGPPPSQLALKVLAWLHHNLGIHPEHITERHDSVLFVVLCVLLLDLRRSPILLTVETT